MASKDHNEMKERSRLDAAAAARLAQLKSMPVDTSRLERALWAHLPADPRAQERRASFLAGRAAWLQPMRAVAAAVLILVALAAVLLTSSSGPALASSAQMAEMHSDLIAGRLPSIQVDSIEAANKVLAAQSPHAPEVPDLPQGHVMACCMKSVKDKKVACVLMKREGVPVSLVVAHGRDMRAPDSPVTQRNGIEYHVQSVGNVNVVMAERDGRWVCLMGELPPDRLMDLADQLRF